MALLNEILAALNNWGAWRRITETPDKIDKLEERVKKLEILLTAAPGETCPSCGHKTLRVLRSKPMPHLGDLGGRLYELKCENCGFTDERASTH